MSINLVETLNAHLTPEVLGKVASFAGGSPRATAKAMGAIVPIVLAGVIGLSSRAGGGGQLAQMLDAGSYDGSALEDLGGLLGGGSTTTDVVSAGRAVAGSVLGNARGSVVDYVVKTFGFDKDSAGSLLSLAAFFAMTVVGALRAQQGLTSDGLVRALDDQRSFLIGIVPAGLGSIAGPSPTSDTDRAVAPAADRSHPTPSRRGLLPGLVLAALALALLMSTI